MKRTLALVVFLFVPFLLFAQPKIEIVGGDTYDWGTVKRTDDPLRAKIKIKNVGTEVLKITEVKPGCGCTTAPLDKNELKPGEEASLDVTLRITGYQGNVTKKCQNSLERPNKSKQISLFESQYFCAYINHSNFLLCFQRNDCR